MVSEAPDKNIVNIPWTRREQVRKVDQCYQTDDKYAKEVYEHRLRSKMIELRDAWCMKT